MAEPRPADAILYPVTPQSGWTSKAVALGEMLRGMGRGEIMYSHVAAVSQHNRFQYEAKWPYAGLFPIDDSRPYEVWRLGDPTPEQTEAALDWWNAHCGDGYNILGLITFGFFGRSHHEVCSQFYAEGWRAAGVQIDSEGFRIVSPNAIADHPSSHKIAAYMPGIGRIL